MFSWPAPTQWSSFRSWFRASRFGAYSSTIESARRTFSRRSAGARRSALLAGTRPVQCAGAEPPICGRLEFYRVTAALVGVAVGLRQEVHERGAVGSVDANAD